MFRRYVISIEVSEAATVNLHGVERELGCSITEPSNWMAYGSTKERGLTFLDKEGKELNSSVFIHQPLFSAPPAKPDNEATEIKEFIYQVLFRHYRSHQPMSG